MKQTDNRQKQQIQLRAERTYQQKNISSEQSGHRSGAPEREQHSSDSGESTAVSKPQIYHAPPQVGRNEPCPCGSGKKFKKCCIDKAAT